MNTFRGHTLDLYGFLRRPSTKLDHVRTLHIDAKWIMSSSSYTVRHELIMSLQCLLHSLRDLPALARVVVFGRKLHGYSEEWVLNEIKRIFQLGREGRQEVEFVLTLENPR